MPHLVPYYVSDVSEKRVLIQAPLHIILSIKMWKAKSDPCSFKLEHFSISQKQKFDTKYHALQEVRKAVLHVFSAVTKQTLPIMGTACLLASSVSKLRSLVSLLLGLPISAFTLSTQSGAELYDCNLLSHYAVQAGKECNTHLAIWFVML